MGIDRHRCHHGSIQEDPYNNDNSGDEEEEDYTRRTRANGGSKLKKKSAEDIILEAAEVALDKGDFAVIDTEILESREMKGLKIRKKDR